MKKMALVGIILMGFVGLAASAYALSYTTVSGDNSPYPGIVFNLDVSLITDSQYHANFSVTTPSSGIVSGWYADWFVFHFDEGSQPTVSNLSPSSGWTPIGGTNGTAVVSQGNATITIPDDGFTGFVLSAIADTTATTSNITGGVDLTPASSTTNFSFDFTLVAGTNLTGPPTPFIVGFYDGISGNHVRTTRLSQDLSNGGGGGGGGKVPEPTTILLLGSGLGCLLPFVRSRFKK